MTPEDEGEAAELARVRKLSASATTWQRFDEIAKERGLQHSHAVLALLVNDAWDAMQKRLRGENG